MRIARMDSLLDKIVRPDIEKHLLPIMLYRGTRSFGQIHRLWNFAITCMESEVETLTDAVRLSQNPDFAHLCGIHKPVQRTIVPGLFGKLSDQPRVTDNIPGLTKYIKEFRGPKYRLTPVSLYTNDPRADSRVAPWRINDYSPEVRAQRAKLLMEKIALKRARVAQVVWARNERRRIRAGAKEERLAWIAQKKTERDIARQKRREQRVGERLLARRAKEPAVPLFYPYLIHKPKEGDDERALLLAVHNAVPKHLPEETRADVCQDLLVSILAGEITQDQIVGNVKGYLAKIRKLHPWKYGDISLESSVGPDDDREMGEVIIPAAYSRLEW